MVLSSEVMKLWLGEADEGLAQGHPAVGGSKANPSGFQTSLWQLCCSVAGTGDDRSPISSTWTPSCCPRGGWRVYILSHALLLISGEFNTRCFWNPLTGGDEQFSPDSETHHLNSAVPCHQQQASSPAARVVLTGNCHVRLVLIQSPEDICAVRPAAWDTGPSGGGESTVVGVR